MPRPARAAVQPAHVPSKLTRAEMTSLVKRAAAAVVRLGGKVSMALKTVVARQPELGAVNPRRVYTEVKCIKQNSSGLFEAMKALEEPEPEPEPAPVVRDKPSKERKEMWMSKVTTEWAAARAAGKKQGLKEIMAEASKLYGDDAASSCRSVERYLETEKVGDGMKARGPEMNFPPDALIKLVKFVGILRTMLVPVSKWTVIDYAQRLIAGTKHAPLFMVLDDGQPRRDDQGNHAWCTRKWDNWYYRRFCKHAAVATGSQLARENATRATSQQRSELVADHYRNFEATLKHLGWAHDFSLYDEADKDKDGVPKEAKLIIDKDKRGRTISTDEMSADNSGNKRARSSSLGPSG